MDSSEIGRLGGASSIPEVDPEGPVDSMGSLIVELMMMA